MKGAFFSKGKLITLIKNLMYEDIFFYLDNFFLTLDITPHSFSLYHDFMKSDYNQIQYKSSNYV